MDLQEFLLNDGYQEVKLAHMLGAGHLQFEAVLNGIEGVFILDTGAGSTVLEASVAEKFNLKLEHTEDIATGAGGSNLRMQFSKGNCLTFGELDVHDLQLALIDLSHVNTAFLNLGFKPVDGILGADILADFEAIIDYKELVLYLKRPK